MKLFKTKTPYLDKHKVKKVALAVSIMTLVLYIIAMICSLLGSKYFILDYQNSQMDKIEAWFRGHQIYGLINILFLTLEFNIVLGFVLKRIPNILYSIPFYGVGVLCACFLDNNLAFGIFPFLFYLTIPIIQRKIDKLPWSWKEYLFCLIRIAIGAGITFMLQAFIQVIKAGYFDNVARKLTLSAQFIYEIEYLIALLIILFTINLFMQREKGDSTLWATDKVPGGSSQTSKKQSQKSLWKNLTKTQKNKLRWLYVRVYLTQIFGFLLLMILPFLVGKVFEFLVMYTSFAIVRYILGFKYSLHYKKESTCITVGVLVFGILSLAVPFFTVLVILAISLGTALAILLHLSYKYKGMWLFEQVSKPDRFALLYVFFDGDLSEHHVKKICCLHKLDSEQTKLICLYTKGEKMTYIAHKFNYSLRMINYKLDEAIDKLIEE